MGGAEIAKERVELVVADGTRMAAYVARPALTLEFLRS